MKKEIIKEEKNINLEDIEKIAEFCPNAECAIQIDGYTTEMAMEAAENIMTAHPEVVALCCINDSGALGAYEAVMAMSGIDYEHFYIAGVDGTPDVCKLIEKKRRESYPDLFS